MRQTATRIGLLLAMSLSLGAAPPETPPSDDPAAAARFEKVHPDLPALERAVVDATLAFIRADSRAAREALDRVGAGCRKISREETPTKLLEDVMLYDQAFQKTVDLAREFATGGQLERSFDQFVWAQKACRTCHGLAVKAGIKAETAARTE
jgi:hypothetical protein